MRRIHSLKIILYLLFCSVLCDYPERIELTDQVPTEPFIVSFLDYRFFFVKIPLESKSKSFAFIMSRLTVQAPIVVYISKIEKYPTILTYSSNVLFKDESAAHFIDIEPGSDVEYSFGISTSTEYSNVIANATIMITFYTDNLLPPPLKGNLILPNGRLYTDNPLKIAFGVSNLFSNYTFSYIEGSCGNKVLNNQLKYFSKYSVDLIKFLPNATDLVKGNMTLDVVGLSKRGISCLNLVAYNPSKNISTIYLSQTLYRLSNEPFVYPRYVISLSELSMTTWVYISIVVFLIFITPFSVLLHTIWFNYYKKMKVMKMKRMDSHEYTAIA